MKSDPVWLSVGLIGIALLTATPILFNESVTFVVGLALIEALFALSWNLLFNYTGIASFGHAAFFALGAYFVGAALRFGWFIPFPIQLVCAAVLGGLFAFVIGVIALRRASGIHLAILTLAVAEVLRKIIGYIQAVGADEGLGGIPRPILHFGPTAALSLRSAAAYYWFILAICLATSLVLWWLVQSRHGRALRSIAQDTQRAAFLGIDTYRFQVVSFTISGAVAGLCGGLSAPWVQIVTPDLAQWLHSAQPMLNTLLGGSGLFWGPALGAFVYAGLNYSTRTLAGASELAIGCILLGIILLAPTGIGGALAKGKQKLEGLFAGKRNAGGRVRQQEGRP